MDSKVLRAPSTRNKTQNLSKYNFFEDRQVSFLGALRTKIKNGKRFVHRTSFI
jgi:hypothetical protein